MGRDEQHSLQPEFWLLCAAVTEHSNCRKLWAQLVDFQNTGFITIKDYNLWIKLITHEDLNLNYLIIILEQH